MFAKQKEIKRNKKEMAKPLNIAIVASFNSDGFMWQEFMLSDSDMFAVHKVHVVRVLPNPDQAVFHLDFTTEQLEQGISHSLYDLALPTSTDPIAAGCYFAHKHIKADVVLINQDIKMVEGVLKQLRTELA